MELLEENQKLKHQNDILRKNIDVLKLQGGHGIKVEKSANSPIRHQIFIGSEEWQQLLQCDEITREMALQYLFNTAKDAEDGNSDFPTISYAIACVKDMMNESIVGTNMKQRNGGNISPIGMNVNNPEMESFIHEVDENESEDEKDMDVEQKPTPEELRALRLNRYS